VAAFDLNSRLALARNFDLQLHSFKTENFRERLLKRQELC
jgi:hypothetical protein